MPVLIIPEVWEKGLLAALHPVLAPQGSGWPKSAPQFSTKPEKRRTWTESCRKHGNRADRSIPVSFNFLSRKILRQRRRSWRLVFDRALFARVHLGLSVRLEEKGGHVPGEEGPGLRIHHVQAVMIDQHRLLLEPIRPARFANLRDYSRAGFSGERRPLKSFARLTAPRASDHRWHYAL